VSGGGPLGEQALIRWVWTASSIVAMFVAVSLLLTPPPTARAGDSFDKALAEIDEALATNPMGASDESIKSCRAMRDTAVLLREIGQIARAVRRLKACRRLLRLEAYPSSSLLRAAGEWG
jgi:hypothetical protein